MWPPGSFMRLLLPTTRAALLELSTRREYPPGAALVREGDRTTHVVLVRSGRLKVLMGSEDGRRVLLAVRMPGDVVGELAAVDGAPRSATVTALGRVVGQVVVGDRFRAFLVSYPDAAAAVIRTAADRLRGGDRRRVEFVDLDARERMARFLAELGRTWGREPGHTATSIVGLTQSELASAIGAAEVTARKAVGELKAAGHIATGRQRIVILSQSGLEEVGRLPVTW